MYNLHFYEEDKTKNEDFRKRFENLLNKIHNGSTKNVGEYFLPHTQV